jgi:aldehyde dehydrogenase (NAD+)
VTDWSPRELVVDRVAAHAIAEARRIFVLQRQARWKVARSTGAERQQKLRALGEAIAGVAARSPRRSERTSASIRPRPKFTEIQLTLTELKDAAANVRRWMKGRRVGTPMHLFGTSSEIRYEAKGVVLIMAAWNFPVRADRCAAHRGHRRRELLHPAPIGESAGEQTACSAASSPRCSRERSRDRGGLRRCGGLSCCRCPFDHIFFTGSTRVGHVVMAAAARTLASVTLELGGKSPAIVDETADVELAAERIAWGKFLSAGQACVAPDYALVHQSRVAEFVAAAKQTVATFYGATEDARARVPTSLA